MRLDSHPSRYIESIALSSCWCNKKNARGKIFRRGGVSVAPNHCVENPSSVIPKDLSAKLCFPPENLRQIPPKLIERFPFTSTDFQPRSYQNKYFLLMCG